MWDEVPLHRARFLGRLFVCGSLALPALGLPACAARHFGPAPAGRSSTTGPIQSTEYRTGRADLRVTAPERGSYSFRLEPSALYPSPPPRLDLSYGEDATGSGLDIQLRPAPGTLATSSNTILTVDLRLPDGRSFTATSMDGECSVTLSRVTPTDVRGRLACRGLQEDLGRGPTVDAAGTFTART